MKAIDYRITYADGHTEVVTVTTRSINAGFRKALDRAREPLGNGQQRDLHSVEFWQVR